MFSVRQHLFSTSVWFQYIHSTVPYWPTLASTGSCEQRSTNRPGHRRIDPAIDKSPKSTKHFSDSIVRTDRAKRAGSCKTNGFFSQFSHQHLSSTALEKLQD